MEFESENRIVASLNPDNETPFFLKVFGRFAKRSRRFIIGVKLIAY